MPLDIEKGVIHTRVIGIAGTDDAGRARQVIIREMHAEPESVKMLYLKLGTSGKVEVNVVFNYSRGTYVIGHIKEGYSNFVLKNPVRIKSWKITGGYPLSTKKDESSSEKKFRAYFGMNITIDILNCGNKQSTIPLTSSTGPEIHPDKRGIFD